MSKRMTVNEIDKFIEKLKSTEELNDDLAEYNKTQAIAYLNHLCDLLEYRDIKSIKIRDAE